MRKTLHSLLQEVGLEIPRGLVNPEIKAISCDSRIVPNGSLFLGLPGEMVDGGIFWAKALSAGALAAVIGSKAAAEIPPGSQDPVVVVSDSVAAWIGKIAAAFWEDPSSQMDLIGVTGTNGKTTTSYLIEFLGNSVGLPSALFGTLVDRWPGYSTVATHTTGFADSLQARLASALKCGARLAAMEVSSHALVQQRVVGCRFSGAVFTNLSQDHLDYHSSMDEYFEAKALLFKSPYLEHGCKSVVINIDDPWGLKLSKRLDGKCWRSSLSESIIKSGEAELSITELEMTSQGIQGLLKTPLGEGRFSTPLIGRFNLMNLLQAVGVLNQHGLPLNQLLEAITDFPGVPGRMERVRIDDDALFNQLPTVLVDYAHTPDGLENALKALKPFTSGDLICVFGCGGDRDRGKRPRMGAIASKYSDRVVITSDNPRNEDPQIIIEQVISGIPSSESIDVELERAHAIELAISQASKNDVVLVAGKGHEDYQIFGDLKVHFDDREEVRRALMNRINS